MTPEEKRERRRAYLREYDRKRRADPEFAARKREQQRKWRSDPEIAAREREYDRKRRADPEFRSRVNHILCGARQRRGCELTPTDIYALWKLQRGRCAYSGAVMTPRGNRVNTMSLERIDSSRGYTRDNVVLVTTTVNVAKSDMTLPEFVAMCRAVAATNPEPPPGA